MEFMVCRLKPKTSFHIGVKEGGLEETLHHVPSDTLFSAFCNIYRMIYGNEALNKLLQEFKENPPFLFSSAFPTIKDKLLLPIPKHIGIREIQTGDDIEKKEIKKVEYVSESFFRKIMRGEKIEIRRKDIAQEGRAIVEDYSGNIWERREVPRVTIDRKTSASEIYFFGEVVFFEGLHFLIDLRNKEYKKEIKTTIRVLGDEGIGGDRTYGKGLFKVDSFEEIKFDEAESQWYTTLSLFYPTDDEIKEIKGYFEFTERGGWVYSLETKGERRKFIRMFTEGSVFNKKIVGRLVEVGKNVSHNVYRYGYAFPLPIKVGE